MVKPSETRQCVLCPKLRDPDSGIEVDVAGRKAWVCDECKADFYRIRIDQLALEERLAQPGWLGTSNSRMTEWCTTRSIAAAVAMGLAKMRSHSEKTRFD